VKLFLLQSRECGRYLRSLRTELAIARRAFNCEYAVSASSSFFAAMGPLFVVWVGGHEVMHDRMTVGQLVACSSLLGFLYGPTRATVASIVGFVRALVSSPEAPGIVFDRVSFGYGSSPVLRRVSLSIDPGASVAIVGPIGAGKSTLLGLIPRLYEPTSGGILIGDRDVATIPLRELRALVSVVSQTPFLVSGSIYDNIRLGDRLASHDEVVRAAQQANAWSFIRTLPKGLETEVGENGSQLSGGQKQLICLARILLRGAPILILDEPTSSIDPQTERLMLESLAAFMKGRTTLIVSHRLSSVLQVQRVVVMQDGEIVDQGTHADLAARNYFYSQVAERARESVAF
jgi:ATP-binding cassette subfamily B protein